VLSLPDFDQLQELFRDPIQRRYEIIRPLILFHDRTATQRAEETHTHPETVGLFPDSVEIVPAGSRPRVSDAVVQELKRLKGLYDGFTYRELVRII